MSISGFLKGISEGRHAGHPRYQKGYPGKALWRYLAPQGDRYKRESVRPVRQDLPV